MEHDLNAGNQQSCAFGLAGKTKCRSQFNECSLETVGGSTW